MESLSVRDNEESRLLQSAFFMEAKALDKTLLAVFEYKNHIIYCSAHGICVNING